MSRTVYLLRHAKSSWDDPQLADIERPLAPRGRKAAKKIARYLRDHDVRPELVGADVDQRAGGDHSAPAEPTHAGQDDRLASLEPVATPPDEVDGLAQRARSLVGHGKPAVVQPERLGSAAEIGNPGSVELCFGG